ncbi:GrpB family protein [candidate division WOR-3 bacterium]|nr:GrpB family protein [candidate division WOR-3 bacterium]
MVIIEYSRNWPKQFSLIRVELEKHLSNFVRIEHIGSTSIPGMKAKPVIDIDIEIRDMNIFELTNSELGKIGYYHNGDQGIPGREAFKRTGDDNHQIFDNIEHHLYICPSDSVELSNHLLFRDYLKKHREYADRYNSIKLEILSKHGEKNLEKYIEVKENEYRWFFTEVIELSRKGKKKA